MKTGRLKTESNERLAFFGLCFWVNRTERRGVPSEKECNSKNVTQLSAWIYTLPVSQMSSYRVTEILGITPLLCLPIRHRVCCRRLSYLSTGTQLQNQPHELQEWSSRPRLELLSSRGHKTDSRHSSSSGGGSGSGMKCKLCSALLASVAGGRRKTSFGRFWVSPPFPHWLWLPEDNHPGLDRQQR